MFYMSEYLEGNRSEYYDRLLAITKNGDWHGWIAFFLNAISVQAERNLNKVRDIRDLYEETKRKVLEITHSQFAIGAVDALFSQPIISGTAFAAKAGFANRVTANNMLLQLEAEGIITRIREGAGRTPAIYALPRLINVTEGQEIF